MFYREGPFFLGYREPVELEDKISGIIKEKFEPFVGDYYNVSVNHATKQLIKRCLTPDLDQRFHDFEKLNNLNNLAETI